MHTPISLTIGIPNYRRPHDLDYLLETLSRSTVQPDEVLVCDDASPESDCIDQVIEKWRSFFAERLIYLKNEPNLGYDRNVRKIISRATSTHVFFIGNDDAIPETALAFVYPFLKRHQHVKAFSRTFLKFSDRLENTKGRSRLFHQDTLIKPPHYGPHLYLRTSAYFSGLIVNREWAHAKATDAYDGSLYYQVYLFGCAYHEGGIGYLDYPTVGGRTDGIPLFGSMDSEPSIHQPGGFSADARLLMWNSILRIASDLDQKYASNSKPFVRKEIGERLCFHVFEKFSQKPRTEILYFIKILHQNQLFLFRNTILLALVNLVFGKKAIFFFKGIRYLFQQKRI